MHAQGTQRSLSATMWYAHHGSVSARSRFRVHLVTVVSRPPMRNTPCPSRDVAPRYDQRLSSRAPLLQNRSVCFVLLPKRWVVDRGFAWAARFRRPTRDYERLAATLASLHFFGLRQSLAASLHRLDFESLTAWRRAVRQRV